MNRAPIIDLRGEKAFAAAHLPGAVNLPLEDLRRRVHELPRITEPVQIVDSDPARAAEAAKVLTRRGHLVFVLAWDPSNLSESGPSTARLWEPNSFLEDALDRMAREGSIPGLALDTACGSGRDAVYLALRGFDVEAIDVLPDALSRAEDLARRSGVSIRTRVQDLEREPVLPRDRYHLLVVFRFLQRSLFSAQRDAIRPGGYVVYETFHELTAKTGHKPRSPDHLLSTGELARAFEGFDVLILREAHERFGRFFSSLLARKPEE